MQGDATHDHAWKKTYKLHSTKIIAVFVVHPIRRDSVWDDVLKWTRVEMGMAQLQLVQGARGTDCLGMLKKQVHGVGCRSYGAVQTEPLPKLLDSMQRGAMAGVQDNLGEQDVIHVGRMVEPLSVPELRDVRTRVPAIAASPSDQPALVVHAQQGHQ